MNDNVFFTAFVALIAILNPLGNLPVFIGATNGVRPGVQRALAGLVSLAIAAFLVGFTFAGQGILDFFGITIPAFRIAGGIIILLMGIGMVRGHAHGESFVDGGLHDDNDYREAKLRLGQILVPVAVPMFVGPGSISTVIVYANRATGIEDLVGLALVCIAASVVVFVTLLLAEWFDRVLGKNGLDIATRILGLFLCAIAVQFMIRGVQDLLVTAT